MKNQIYRAVPAEIKFSDTAPTTDVIEIQLFRCGKFHDGRYGTTEITSKALTEMVKNFKENTRGVDIALDFSHDNEGKAAGWFTELETREGDTQLWGKVKLTEAGKQSVSSKEFRYISPEFNLNYEDNESRKKHGAIILGAGLTNRPVIKAMAPAIALSELTQKELQDMKTLEELAAANAEQAKKITEMEEAIKKFSMPGAPAPVIAPAAPAAVPPVMTIEQAMAKISELQAQLAAAESAQKMSEKNKAFDKMLSEGKVCEAQRDAYVKDDVKTFAEKAAPVKLNPQGSKEDPAPEGDDKRTAVEIVGEKASAMAKEKSMSFKEATRSVLASDEKLAQKYAEETKV